MDRLRYLHPHHILAEKKNVCCLLFAFRMEPTLPTRLPGPLPSVSLAGFCPQSLCWAHMTSILSTEAFSRQKHHQLSQPKPSQSDNGSPMDTSLTDILLPIQKHVASLVTDQRQLHNLSTYLFTYSRCIHQAPVEPEPGPGLGAGGSHVLKTMCISRLKPAQHNRTTISQDEYHCFHPVGMTVTQQWGPY